MNPAAGFTVHGERMPVVFVGHGSPMNRIEDNRWSRGFSALGERVPRPAAILAVSAHWYVGGTCLTGNAAPETIHDFGGFPLPLYEVEYPDPGKVDLAERVRSMLGEERTSLRDDWGLDHGTWSVLRWMYPDADFPAVQLSIDRHLRPRQHYELARSLGELRDCGVLILGSGNIVHNLHDAFTRKPRGDETTPDWARRFDDDVSRALDQHDYARLLTLWPDTDDGRISHPTPDHWLPLIYSLGTSGHDDKGDFPLEGFDWGSLSMRAVLFG